MLSAKNTKNKSEEKPASVHSDEKPNITTSLDAINLALTPVADRMAHLARENYPGFSGKFLSYKIQSVLFFLNYAAHYNSEYARDRNNAAINAFSATLIDTGFSAIVAFKTGLSFALYLEIAEFSAPFGRRVLDTVHHNVRNLELPKTEAEMSRLIDDLETYAQAAEFAGYFVTVGESISWLKGFFTRETISNLSKQILYYGLKALESINQGMCNFAIPNTTVLVSSLDLDFRVIKEFMAIGRQAFSKEKYDSNSITKPSSMALAVTGPGTSNQWLQVSGSNRQLQRTVLPAFTWDYKPNSFDGMNSALANLDLNIIKYKQPNQTPSKIPAFLITLPQPTSPVSINFSNREDVVFEIKFIIPFVPSFEPMAVTFNIGIGIINLYNFNKAKNIKNGFKKNKRRGEELNDLLAENNKLTREFNQLLNDNVDDNLIQVKAKELDKHDDKCIKRADRNFKKIDNNKYKEIRHGLKKTSKQCKDIPRHFQQKKSDRASQIQAHKIQGKLNGQAVLIKDIYCQIESALKNTNDKTVNLANAQDLIKVLSSNTMTQLKSSSLKTNALIQTLLASLNPNNVEAIKELMNARASQDRLVTNAELMLNKAISQLLFRSDESVSDVAIEYYQTCHKADPLNPEFLNYLAYVDLENGSWFLAISRLDQARKLNPDDKLTKEITGDLAHRGYRTAGFICELLSISMTWGVSKVLDKEKASTQVLIASFNLASVPYLQQLLLLQCCPTKYKSDLKDYLVNNKYMLDDVFSILNAVSATLNVVIPIVPRRCQEYINRAQTTFDIAYRTGAISYDIVYRHHTIVTQEMSDIIISVLYFINNISALTSYAERAYRLRYLQNRQNLPWSENRVFVASTSLTINPISLLGMGLLVNRNSSVIRLIGRGIVNNLPSLSRNIGISSVVASGLKILANPYVKASLLGIGVLRASYNQYKENMCQRLINNADILVTENQLLPAIAKYDQASKYTNDQTTIEYKKAHARCIVTKKNAEVIGGKSSLTGYKEIIQICNKQLELETEKFSLKEPLHYLLAQCKIKLKDKEGAKKDLLTIIWHTKYPVHAYWLLAEIAGKNLKEAQRHLSKAISLYEKLETDLKNELDFELIRSEALHVQLEQLQEEIQNIKKQNDNIRKQIQEIDIFIKEFPERTRLLFNDIANKIIQLLPHSCNISSLKNQFLLMANAKLHKIVVGLKKKLLTDFKEILTDDELKNAYDHIDQCYHDVKRKVQAFIGTNRQIPPSGIKLPSLKKHLKITSFVKEHNQVPDCKGSMYEIDVPGDGSCWLYAPVLAALLPLINQSDNFKKMFRKLFELEKEKLSDDTIEANRLALFHYNGTKEFFKVKDATYEVLVNTNLRNKLEAYIQANQKQIESYSSDFKAELKSAGEAFMPGGTIQLHALSGMLERQIYIYQEKNEFLEQKEVYKNNRDAEPLRLVFVPGDGLGHYHYLIEPKWIKQLLSESKNTPVSQQNTGELVHSNRHTMFSSKPKMQQDKTIQESNSVAEKRNGKN